MNTRLSSMDKTLRKTLSVSLVVAMYAGCAAAGSGLRTGEKAEKPSVEMVRTAAAGGDAEALYWLAMMHIEGSIEGADYDHGVELLQVSARHGHKDAERMYAFRNSAFCGEGC